MADKQISQLVAATTLNNEDLLVIQQGQVAKKLSGEALALFVYSAAGSMIDEVNSAVEEAQAAVDELLEEKNTIAQTIADMAQLGTDTTLTTPAMAADAKAAGDRIRTVEANTLANFNTRTIKDVAIASFDDGAENVPVKDLVIDINPVQDLHGQDAPYPAGGGSNVVKTASDMSIVIEPSTKGVGVAKTVLADNVLIRNVKYNSDEFYNSNMSSTVTTSGNTINATTNNANYGVGICVSASPSTTYYIGWTEQGIDYARAVSIAYYDASQLCISIDPSNGDLSFPISVTTPANTAFIVICLRAIFSGGSSVERVISNVWISKTNSGFAPYSNVCPITGWINVDVDKYGGNLWDDTWYTDVGNGLSLITDETDPFYGYYAGSIYNWSFKVPVKADVITVTADYGNAGSVSYSFRVYFYYDDGTSGYDVNIDVNGGGKTTASRTSSADKKCIGYRVDTGTGPNNMSGRIKNVMVSANGNTNYEEPNHKLYRIFFPNIGNLFNGEFIQGYWAYANGYFVSDTKWICTGKIPCKPSTEYTASADEKLTRWQGFVWYDIHGKYLGTSNRQSNENIGLTRQSPNNAAYMAFNIAGYPNASAEISPFDVTHFKLEEGASATQYQPQNLVYGGTVDLVSGDGANNRAKTLFSDIPSNYFSLASSNALRITNPAQVLLAFPNIKLPATNYDVANVMCNIGKAVGASPISYNDQYNACFAFASGGAFYLVDTSCSTVEEYRTRYADAVFVYEVAEPVSFSMTPTPVNTLLKENNIWANTGNINTLTYRSLPITDDVLREEMAKIESMLAGRESSNTATKNYSVGNLVIASDTLYRVTAAIATGETFTPGAGGNVSQTTIADELATLQALYDNLWNLALLSYTTA